MTSLNNDGPTIDTLAALLAARAGVSWDGLNAYPGYGRTRWREEARSLLAGLRADPATSLG